MHIKVGWINDLVLQNRLSAEKVHFNLQNILQPHPLIIMGGSKLIKHSFFLLFNVIIHRVDIVCQENRQLKKMHNT